MSAPDSNDLAQRALRTRRIRDMSLVLPLIGVLIFLSPVIRIASGGGTLMGLPLIFFYLFGFWAIFIALTRALSRKIDQDSAE